MYESIDLKAFKVQGTPEGTRLFQHYDLNTGCLKKVHKVNQT